MNTLTGLVAAFQLATADANRAMQRVNELHAQIQRCFGGGSQCLDTIVSAAALAWGVQPAQIRGRGRVQRVCYARWAVFAVLADMQWSHGEISAACGQVDRSTVSYGIGALRIHLDQRPDERARYDAFRAGLAQTTNHEPPTTNHE